MPLFTHPAPTPETWTPEGTLVSQRFRALEGAIVLVYTADADRGSAKYALACLGCTYRAATNAAHNPMSETDAAKDAALHRAIGIGAAAVTTWLTTRPGGRR